jgi:hypothetical protein
MSVKVKLKNSTVKNKAPLPADLDIGEVAINANVDSPAAYIKDSAGNIVKLAGAGSVSTPAATATTSGIVQLADAAAVTAGTAGRVVDAAQLKAAVAAEDLWDRTGTEITPKTAGDSVFTSGAVKVGGTTAAPNLQIKADGGIVANTDGLVYDPATKRLGIGTTTVGHNLEVRSSGSNDGSFFVGNASGPGLHGGYSTGSSGAYVQAYNTTSSAFADLNINGSAVRFGTGPGAPERARIDGSGRLLVGTSSQSGGSLLQVNDNRIRIATAKTPASATDAGVAGEICWDANYVYVCTATNTWKRTAIATW